MLIRCRCGTYTNFGLTCTKCRELTGHPSHDYEEPEEEEVVVEETEDEDD